MKNCFEMTNALRSAEALPTIPDHLHEQFSAIATVEGQRVFASAQLGQLFGRSTSAKLHSIILFSTPAHVHLAVQGEGGIYLYDDEKRSPVFRSVDVAGLMRGGFSVEVFGIAG